MVTLKSILKSGQLADGLPYGRCQGADLSDVKREIDAELKVVTDRILTMIGELSK